MPLGGDLAEAFHRAHEERYGYADRARPLELVAVRTADVRPGARASRRPRRPPRTVDGPGVVELDGATVLDPAGLARRDWTRRHAGA